jgi:hypothetical protein
MSESVCENACRIADSVPGDPHKFWQWYGPWPGLTTRSATWTEQMQTLLTGCTEIFVETLTKLTGSLESQIQAGLKTMEGAMHLAMAREAQEYCTRLGEYWRRSFDCLRPITEIQMAAANFLTAVESHIVGGMKTVSEEVYQQRLAACAACDFFRDNHCLQCGCRLAGDVVAKARWTTESCPMGHWAQVG